MRNKNYSQTLASAMRVWGSQHATYTCWLYRTKHASRMFCFHFHLPSCLHICNRLVSTSASDWLERLVSEMNYNVLMGTLNPTHSPITHCNRLACWVWCGNALERFVVIVVKMCGFGLVEIALVMVFTLLHVAYRLVQKFARTFASWLCSKVMSK